MISNRTTTIATYGVLGLAACVTLMLPTSVVPIASATPIEPLSWNPPATVRLNGVVRDFKSSHVDFDVTPADGLGHRANNVALSIGSGNVPVFNAGSDTNGPFENRLAHWKFDDGSGSVVSDDLGANDGTLVDGTWSGTGQSGGCLQFDGVNDYVEIPSSPQIQVTGDITFAGWFKLDTDFDASSPDTMVIMEKYLDTEHDFHIGLAGLDYNRPEVAKGSLVFKVENGPDSDYYCYVWTTRQSWQAGVWYHFACVLDSDNTALNTIYIDAADETAATIAAGVGFLDTDYNAPMRIGGKTIDYNGAATDIYFKGMIDDIVIFDRALTPADLVPAPGGFEVATQWYDGASNKIAPHLYAVSDPGADTVQLVSAPTIENSALADSYDSSVGPYGGANVDVAPTFVSGATMPTVTVPTGLPYQAAVIYDGSSTSIRGTNVECDTFFVENSHVLTITGDVTIVVNNAFEIENNSAIVLAPAATLTVYSLTSSLFNNNGDLNLGGSPADVQFYHLGAGSPYIQNSCDVYAEITAPSATLEINNTGVLFGRYTGAGLNMINTANYHHDRDGVAVADVCGNTLADAAGTARALSTGGITSADTFAQWFDDVLGVNLSCQHSIDLTLNGSYYEYINTLMYPVDGNLMGNEGGDHNRYFTYTVPAIFTYDACAGQFFEFEGGDGAWLFVNGQLAIDLGGVISGNEQRIDLDRMTLVDGELYEMRLFYAQRNANSSLFTLRTNVVLTQQDHLSVSAGFD